MQGVCDHKGQFIDIDIRWPGAIHDAKVFAYSSINTILHEQAQPYLTKTYHLASDCYMAVGVLNRLSF